MITTEPTPSSPSPKRSVSQSKSVSQPAQQSRTEPSVKQENSSPAVISEISGTTTLPPSGIGSIEQLNNLMQKIFDNALNNPQQMEQLHSNINRDKLPALLKDLPEEQESSATASQETETATPSSSSETTMQDAYQQLNEARVKALLADLPG